MKLEIACHRCREPVGVTVDSAALLNGAAQFVSSVAGDVQAREVREYLEELAGKSPEPPADDLAGHVMTNVTG